MFKTSNAKMCFLRRMFENARRAAFATSRPFSRNASYRRVASRRIVAEKE
tara:strand:+ start:423 stop:572 length:150 start_codon:yes stop_codon:yes gene_type:complete